jgi:ABC-type glycerol-3-phosphate transport system substrate-binding protein
MSDKCPMQGRLTCACGMVAALYLMFAPGCGPAIKMTALVSMMPDQEEYFTEEVVPAFEKEHHARITVVHYGTVDSLEEYLRAYKATAGLVKIPFDRRTDIIEKGLVKPVGDLLSAQQRSAFKNEYLLTSLGESNGQPCLIPRKFETRIMVYCKSKVAEAAGEWRKYKDEMSADLKRMNGGGLPADFYLEEDPNEWDYFDFFVVGWIWSHTQYNGRATGRIGLRGKRYSGTWLGIVDRVYQLGGDSSAVLSMKGDAVVDAFHWEAIYAASGVYNPEMWGKGWGGADIWRGFASSKVFLSFMTQLDCFFLHGTGRDNLLGYFKNPDDMGVALIPKACSGVLSSENVALRNGTRAITTGGWWWGIPASSPDPAGSYEFASFITSTPQQIQECSRFGMVPVRKDVLSDMNMLFGGGWISCIYETSFKQLMQNGLTTLPANPKLGKIGDVYLDAWYDIVANKNWSADKMFPQRDYIRETLATKYAVRAQRILGGAE